MAENKKKQAQSKAPVSEEDTDKESKVYLAKMTLLQVVLAALISVLGAGVTGYFGYQIAIVNAQEKKPAVTVPERTDVVTVPELGDSGGEGIQLLRDVSIFDLRGWRQVPAAEKDKRYSPVNYINYLHLKKTRPTKVYRAHYATTGVAIDLRCISHKHNVLLQATPIEHSGTNMKEYAVEVDIESMPINQEFLIVIEGTYWNSFQNLEEEFASTYTDTEIEQLSELALVVLLPESKPFKNYRLWSNPSGSSEKEIYSESSKFYADKEGHFLYWSIADRKKDYHYSVSWNW